MVKVGQNIYAVVPANVSMIFFSLCNIDTMVYLNHKLIAMVFANCILKSQEYGICSFLSVG